MKESTADEALRFVRKFTSRIEHQDRATMAAMILPTVRIHKILSCTHGLSPYGTITRNGAPLTMSLPAIIDTRWDSPVEVYEQIYDEIVRVDRDLVAVAWTPYKVRALSGIRRGPRN